MAPYFPRVEFAVTFARPATSASCSRIGQKGFTLIEVMVVLMIIGIGTAAISLSVRPDPARALRQDAQQLAQRFIIAQSEVRLDGRSIVWQADRDGYRFVRATWVIPDNDVIPVLSPAAPPDTFSRDDSLRPRHWQSGAVQVDPRPTVTLDAERVGAPWEIQLSDGTSTVSVMRDAVGRFSVH